MVESNTDQTSESIYPLRASEQVQRLGFLAEVAPMELDEADWGEIREFEKGIYDTYLALKQIDADDHNSYLMAFLNPSGNFVFRAVYTDPSLTERVEEVARDSGFDLEKKGNTTKLFDAVFDDLEAVSQDLGKREKYFGEGVKFENLGKLLGDDVEIAGETDVERVEGLEEVKDQFWRTDLSGISGKLLSRTATYSGDRRRRDFSEAYRSVGGDVEEIADPLRVTKIEDLEKLGQKADGYRKLKSRMREVARELRSDESKVGEAKRLVLNLYRRALNVSIGSELYPLGRVLATQPNRTDEENEVLDLIRGRQLSEIATDRFSGTVAARTIERVDHFLQGVGMRVGANGLLESIPEKLAEHARLRLGEAPIEKTEEFEKYNEYKVTPEQAKRLAEVLLEMRGFDKTGWGVRIRPGRSYSAEYDRTESGITKYVKVPEKVKSKGLVEAIAVIEHEIAHAARYESRDRLASTSNLAIFEGLSLGRTVILAEGSAMFVQGETQKEMVGTSKVPLPYYFAAIEQKREGGSYKDCFDKVIRMYCERNFGKSLDEVMIDPKQYKKAADYTWGSVRRIFRRGTPLDDDTGFVPDSTQLKYMEQELVVEALMSDEAKEQGLDKLLYVLGIDLYSLGDMKRLGVLDLEEVESFELIGAKVVWPILKEQLDAGKSVEEAIQELERRKERNDV